MSREVAEDEPVDSHLLVSDVVSVEFVPGSLVRSNLTDNTELQREIGEVGGAFLPVFLAYFRNRKSYQSSHE